MTLLKEFPVLESVTSKGKKKFWQMVVVEKMGKCGTFTRFWQEGATVQESEVTWVEPKNVGRANETVPVDQAYSEANSTIKKQKDKGYHEPGKQAGLTLPMLAQPWDKSAHRLSYPVIAQPKFDGNRALTDGTKMWSRKGITFNAQVVEHLLKVIGKLDHSILDGELIMPHGTLLQHTRSAIAKFHPSLSPKLLYRVYDIITPGEGLDYEERIKLYEEIVYDINDPHIIAAPWVKLDTEEDVFSYHAKMGGKGDGWEGIVVKNLRDAKTGLPIHYSVGQRPGNAMVKLKEFWDEEYEVADVEELVRGKYAGCGLLVCVTPRGEPFKSLPVGTIEFKRSVWRDRLKYLGTYWTIRHQGLSKDGVPQHGRAIAMRDAETDG